MMKKRPALWPTILLGVVSLWGLQACSGPRLLNTVTLNPDRDTRIVRNVAYGEDPRQRMDIYVPDRAGPTPVLVYVHGGSWMMGNKGEYAFVGKRFAAEGILTAVISYRLAPEDHYPDFVVDTGLAAAKIAALADQYGGDPDQVFIAGHSAGAYNAVQLVMAPETAAQAGISGDDIAGVIGLAGPYAFNPKKTRRAGGCLRARTGPIGGATGPSDASAQCPAYAVDHRRRGRCGSP